MSTALRIGIDFDNTIVCYDGVFHAEAVRRGLIPAVGVATDKTSVRDHLRGLGQDRVFTALQGHVYGPGMAHAQLYPGLERALSELARAGHELFVISHRTSIPFAGPAHDLPAFARGFIADRGLTAWFAPERVFFEPTREAKTARALQVGCHAFVDDLPKVLADKALPSNMRRLLFDPDRRQLRTMPGVEVFADWASLGSALLQPAPVP